MRGAGFRPQLRPFASKADPGSKFVQLFLAYVAHHVAPARRGQAPGEFLSILREAVYKDHRPTSLVRASVTFHHEWAKMLVRAWITAELTFHLPGERSAVVLNANHMEI